MKKSILSRTIEPFNKVYGADPNVLFNPVSKTYFCYATLDNDHLHFEILESKDLVNWKQVGFAIDDRDDNNWCSTWFWAPECYYNPNNGYYYLFYSAKVLPNLVKEYFNDEKYDECCKIGVAVSKSPKGPFKNITNRPLDYYPFDPQYTNIDKKYSDIFRLKEDKSYESPNLMGEYLSSIDVNVFFDEDNRIYLFFSRCCYHNAVFDADLNKYIEESNICGVELNNEWWFSKNPIMPTIKNEYVKSTNNRRCDRFLTIICYKNDPQDWENGHINDYEKTKGKKHNRRWSEGSTTFIKYINGKKKYFLTYSCNNYENEMYGVGIAFSDSPLGPYKKYVHNPIISEQNNLGIVSTGHGSIIEKNNNFYYLHHGRNNSSDDRSLFISKFLELTCDSVSVDEMIQCALVK